MFALKPSHLVLLGLLPLGRTPLVSDPIGVYAIIDRVALEPSPSEPQTIQIWGVFAMSNGQPGDTYLPAVRGHLLYTINPQNARASRAEWSDLRGVAGMGQPIGFGMKYRPLGHVRHGGGTDAAPDVYPLGFGLVRVTQNPLWNAIVRDLRSVPEPLSPADGARIPAGAVRLTVRSLADSSGAYFFEIESGATREKSPAIPVRRGEVSWSPGLRVRAGDTYAWRVWVEDNGWKGQPATASFRGAQ